MVHYTSLLVPTESYVFCSGPSSKVETKHPVPIHDVPYGVGTSYITYLLDYISVRNIIILQQDLPLAMADAESWDELPTYFALARGTSEYLKSAYHDVFVEPSRTTKLDSWNITMYDITWVALLTVILSILRHILDKNVSTPIAIHYNIPEASRKKVPESAWRFAYYFSFWCYTWYVMVWSGKYKFLQKPDTMWHGWSLETPLPGDIYFIYVVNVSFYLHWTYTTFFVDAWKKDFLVLVIHHAMTLSLIFLSYNTRCHNIGVLMLFLHDMSDIVLEFSKLGSYFIVQGLETKRWIERMAVVGFACFKATWFVSRLYWYPLKVVYSAVVHAQRLGQKIPYHFQMDHLLLFQLVLNIYWSVWILKAFYRIANGKRDDPRDDDMEEMLPERLNSSHILKKEY